MVGSFRSILLDEAKELPPHDLLSKDEFVHAVDTLARKLPASFASGDLEHLFLACPFDTWKEAFGEPLVLQEHHAFACQSAIETWEQPCSDGVVHCVGHFVLDPNDQKWVILTRVCLY